MTDDMRAKKYGEVSGSTILGYSCYFDVLLSLSLLLRNEWYTIPASAPNGIPTPILCMTIPNGKPIMIIPHKMHVLRDLLLCLFSLLFSSFSIVDYLISFTWSLYYLRLLL